MERSTGLGQEAGIQPGIGTDRF